MKFGIKIILIYLLSIINSNYSIPFSIFHYTTKRKELFSLKGTSFAFWIGELVGKHLYIYVFIVHAFILTDRELYVIHQIFTRVREKTHTDRNRFFSLYAKKINFKILRLRRVWRYQKGNQNPYIEEEQTKQWTKEKVQKDKQRSTKHTHKTKEQVTRTPLRIEGELGGSGRISSSSSTSGTRRVNLVTNPVISLEWGKDQEVIATIGTYPWSFVTQIFHNGQP